MLKKAALCQGQINKTNRKKILLSSYTQWSREVNKVKFKYLIFFKINHSFQNINLLPN